MECNRDEAARAKEIAEKKFLANDIVGAKKFATKAQNLYPELEGISHMLATLNVYVSAENKINGEPDWYGILGVNPLADEATVRKEYRKLVLMLHPDKNKAKGADGAFNLISQAWNLLSDKAKRSTYDQKRNAKGFQQNVQPPRWGSPTPPGQNGFYNFTKSATSNMNASKGNSTSVPASSHKQKPTTAPSSHKEKPTTVPASSHKQKPPTVSVSSHKKGWLPAVSDQSQEPKQTTFWTACHRCKMQHEYLRMYLNRNLLCPYCHEPYFSYETAPPPANGSKYMERNNSQQRQNSAHQSVSKNNPSTGINNSASPNVGSGGFGGSNSSNHASTVPASSHKQKPSTVPVSSHEKRRLPTVPDPSQEPKQNTFWTVCHRCKIQYEYLRMYLNCNLLCPNCHEPYFSFETTPPPANGSKYMEQNNSQQRQNSAHQRVSKNNPSTGINNSASPNVGSGGFNGSNSSNHANFQWTPFSKTAGTASASQAASMVQQAYEKVKREREEAQAATKREESLRRKNHASEKAGDVSSDRPSNAAKRRRDMEDLGAGEDTVDQMGMGNGVGSTETLSGLRQNNFEQLKVSRTSNSTRDVSIVRIQHLLIEKARMEIHKKLYEWNLGTMAKYAVRAEESLNEKAEEKEKEKEKAYPMVKGARRDENKSCEPFDARNDIPANKSIPSTSVGALDRMPMSMDVPDSDFHDFDKDRTEKCFGENQVWAAYDDDDGMPRYYAMIHYVICLNPFTIRISWLNSKTNNELGPLNWIGSGFSKTCGDFKIGKHEINFSINSFSHKVRWTKGSSGTVEIYPRKGDVWSLYTNWSPEWNELTADEVIHQYNIVEVLEDYDDEQGVTVTALVKVAGFKTVFHRHLDHREVQRIPREEMFRFSHYIPSYLLTGQEAPNAPKGCLELDPAATPFELLHVVADVKDAEIMENEENCNKDPIVDNVGKPNSNVMEEISNKAGEEISEKSNKQGIEMF